jgi:hypothetical protein
VESGKGKCGKEKEDPGCGKREICKHFFPHGKTAPSKSFPGFSTEIFSTTIATKKIRFIDG